jgi:hypothetical protein
METDSTHISIKGKQTEVKSADVDGQTVVVKGKWFKVAEVMDEAWLAGQTITHPEQFIDRLKAQRLGADLFTFMQKLPDTKPRFAYALEMDNVAATPTTSFAEWWEHRLPQESRKNARRAAKRGVVTKSVPLTDELIRQIVEIYNESPIRQGVPFWHFGKNFETVKREISTFPDQSEFIGAYLGEELIGFIKVVYAPPVANMMQIVSKNAHRDKRPTNALIAKAVEICEQKGFGYLVYGKYSYGNKTESTLSDFKHRNGFEKILVPRYYVPLTLYGRVILLFKLHRGLLGLIPSGCLSLMLNLRAKFYRNVWLPLRLKPKTAAGPVAEDGQSD